MNRHWSFVVTDRRYLYPIAVLLLIAGLVAAFLSKDANNFTRAGNFIIGTGVWMSMRYTLREGINRRKDLSNSSPTFPGTNQVNPQFFNQIAFSIGDAQAQVHGFILVILGSVVGSFGDLILKCSFPGYF
ncbi:hypothetical protein [Paraburkholderia haematera]|uniref:Uncharacterized protein n=1 Tax=Paraburkholderia haematera TaxID=2793077 RepID=A0ABM8QT55_9BURK|nr:hypothetical protein [Paraburkholderia haematera]CAE6714040.1 hypothetical protein R69888_01286 [Paraburkholderia haematera]